MENNKIKVSVFVAGQRFNIITEKSEKYVMDIASEIDARINSLVLSQDMSRERAAVLTAMDYADDRELDKENITAVKEQIKDYLQEIERLQDNNSKIIGDYNLLKAEYERLIEEHRSAEEAEKALDDCEKRVADLQKQLKKKEERISSMENAQKALKESQAHIDALQSELRRMEEQFEEIKQQNAENIGEDEIPLPEPPEEKEERPITAEDDLFFESEPEEEAPLKPEKKKKNKHDHSHVNPYQQKAKQKEKGYTQQRQYSFFDDDAVE